ncbi:isovaleryl-CoA dehydrogenase [Parvibaculum sedimenti]|uniref:Isovaleryl-CoA dehydrogenase n=1 Tax=Parvibaculum sedimenti TaxID=2608632 RepID=A0A6N6VHA6_9HYPH|nr:isovaleryl-CoA dehydrogenase [Parvibaculum sedimenti]KAB7740187.1 isovaleryl-CoA dehydrogenase [Parvibaculum sedimenti]
MTSPSNFATHEVFNQPPALEGYNLFTSDRVLAETVEREGAGDAAASLTAFGAKLGTAEVIDLGRQANTYLPVLKSFDRFGHRTDRVEFHPSYHQLMALSVEQGLQGSPWEHLLTGGQPQPGAVVARLAGTYMMTQIEAGHGCPITMTNAAVPALLFQHDLAKEWVPRILSRKYDGRFIPAKEKTGVTFGMGMTEKQGGTDVRANTTVAEPVGAGGPGAEYRVTGHKWFFSAPMCDAFLVLAQAPGGLSCFLMPRFTPDGEVNPIRIQRLKEKVGNRSNASSEVEFQAASAWLIGEEGRGVRNIIEMATYTRLDCAVATAGMMRQAVAQAVHHCSYRTVFQKKLIDQPLMANVLADLALETEAATALSFRVARSFDRAESNEQEAAFRRIMTPVAKYWVCKRAPNLAYEAMECLGGNGYVEEGIAGRIYREMPVNAIWEGSGNVMCLDVLRALSREPDALNVVIDELETSRGANRAFDGALDALKDAFTDLAGLEGRSRQIVEMMAKLEAGAILIRHAPEYVSDAYCATRLGRDWGDIYGTLPAGVDQRAILERARVVR